MRLRHKTLFILFLLVFFLFCSKPTQVGDGGSVTDVGNTVAGKIYKKDGQPAAQVRVSAWEIHTRADTLSSPNQDTALTQSDGAYEIIRLAPGIYHLLGETVSGEKVLSDSVVIHFGKNNAAADTLKAAGVLQGILATGPFDSTLIYIPGTPYSANLNQDGSYRFAALPAGQHNLVVLEKNSLIATQLASVVPQETTMLTLTRSTAVRGFWTSAAELSAKPRSGPAWEALQSAADENTDFPDVANQDDPVNVRILAAAIMYICTGFEHYKNKVISACQSLSTRRYPGGITLAWARETGAYALAADLVGFRSTVFENWLDSMANHYRDSDLNETLIEMFHRRPNNWGSSALGSLCAIYAYLNDTTALQSIRDYWIQGVSGPNPGYKYDKDLSWHLDSANLRLINPVNAVKQGINIDGIIPDCMRMGGALQSTPLYTQNGWEYLQGLVMAGRILERLGWSIWEVEQQAIYRAAYAMQVGLAGQHGDIWKAKNDDLWLLAFLDDIYHTQWAQGQTVWGAGKNAGWAYVLK